MAEAFNLPCHFDWHVSVKLKSVCVYTCVVKLRRHLTKSFLYLSFEERQEWAKISLLAALVLGLDGEEDDNHTKQAPWKIIHCDFVSKLEK